MSRLGKRPIELNKDVSISSENTILKVTGPKGELELNINSEISFEISDDNILLTRKDDSKKSKELHGLYWALLNNMIEGVSKGFTHKLELHGIGYRVQQKGTDIELSLGYSHPVLFKVPEGVIANVDGQTKINLSSIDKQLLGETCARIKRLRRKDPYKGKGVHSEGAVIRKKPGKSVKK